MPPHELSCQIDDVSLEERSTLSINNFPKDQDCDSVVSPCSSRRVSFAAHTEVHEVMSHEDYTYMERKSSWRTPYEEYQSKFNLDKVVTRIQQGKPCKGDMTYRGLEQYFRSGDQGMHLNSREILKAVLNEQNRQRQLESCDPEAIASVSASLSEKCRLRALELAKDDERQVQTLLDAARSKRQSAPSGLRSSWWSLRGRRKSA